MRVQARTALRGRVPARARAAFRIDLTSMLFQGFYVGAVFPFLSVLARGELKASPDVLALMAAAPAAGSLLSLFWVRMMEGRLKAPFVVWAQLLSRCMVALTLFTRTALPFALVVGGSQLVGSVTSPAYAAVVRQLYPAEYRGRIMAWSRAGILLTQVIGTLVSGYLLQSVGIPFYYVFPCAAVFGVIGAILYRRIQPFERLDAEPTPSTQRLGPIQQTKTTARFIWNNLSILKHDRAFRMFAIAVFIYGFGNLLTVPIRPLIEVDELKITPQQISALNVMLQIVALFSYFWWGNFIDRRNPQIGVVVSVFMNALVPLIYILLGTVLPLSPWVLLAAYGVMGFVTAGIDLSYFNAILMFGGQKDVSRYQGLQSFLFGIRGTVAPLLGGRIAVWLTAANQDLRWGLALGLLLSLIGCAIQARLLRHMPERERD